MAGTRKTITLDEKIEKAQEAVEKAKARYDAAVKELRELSFQSLLKQGYEENRGILIACFYDRKFPGMAKQAYIELDDGRYMICYTSKKAAKSVRESDDWAVASIRDILNNFFNKDAAAGLLFNPYCENMMIVPKPLLEILMPGDKEKPPFYQEPKQ